MSIESLLNDPDGAACRQFYDNENDNAAAACYNANTLRGPVPFPEIWDWAYDSGVLGKWFAVAADGSSTPGFQPSTEFLDLAQRQDLSGDGASAVDLDSTFTVVKLDAMEAAGVITAGERAWLDGLGNNRSSLSDRHLGQPVTATELGEYRLENP